MTPAVAVTERRLAVRDLARRVYADIWEHEILDRAASLSYYFLFALFPSLLFLTALLGLSPVPDLMDKLLGHVGRVLPSDAASLVRKTLAEIVRGASGGLLSVGVVAALWATSTGMLSIMTALNVVYGVRDERPWWFTRLIAIGLTVVFSLFTLAAVLLMVFGERIGEAFAAWAGLGSLFALTWRLLQWPAVVLFALTAVSLVYYLAPAARRTWRWLSPGSGFAVLAWLLASSGLRVYVAYVGDYNATYGSIGGVILLMLWLYVSSVVLLVGAQIDAEMGAACAAGREPPPGGRPSRLRPRGAGARR